MPMLRLLKRAVLFTLPLFILILLASLLFLAKPSRAADWGVGTCDWATFKAQLDAAQADGGGRVHIDCSGVIDFPDRVDITRPVTIEASQQVTFTQSNGTNNPQFNRHFQVFPTQALTLTGVTLTGAGTNGSLGGSIYLDGGASLRLEDVRVVQNEGGGGGAIAAIQSNVTIVSSEFLSNTARYDSGALYLDRSFLHMTDSLLQGNKTTEGQADGGAILAESSHMTMTDVAFIGNISDLGGAIQLRRGSLMMVRGYVAQNRGILGGGILSDYNPVVTIIDSDIISNSVVFHQGFTGEGGGIALSANSRWTLHNSRIIGNTATDTGGGVFVKQLGEITITESVIATNTAAIHGGGIGATGSVRVNLDGVELSGNVAAQGSGGAYYGVDEAQLRAIDTDFIGNRAIHASGGHGGAIYQHSGSLYIEGGSFAANRTLLSGGALSTDASNVAITGTLFTGNRAQTGGAIMLLNANTWLTETTVFSNTATRDGGGIVQSGGELSVQSSTVVGNGAVRDGGGIAQNGGALSIVASTIVSNSANQDGGGVIVANPASQLTLRDSTVLANTGGFGGGVYFYNAGASTLENVTISRNLARTDGGGVMVLVGAPVTITHATIAENHVAPGVLAVNGAGIGTLGGAQVGLYNSVLDNPALGSPSASEPNCNIFDGSTIESAGVVATDDSCGVGATEVANTGLLPLADNGGKTFTHLPAPGSPVTNAGVPAYGLPTDQRGLPRPAGGGYDAGAVEVQLDAPPTAVTLSPPAPIFAGAQPPATHVGVLATVDADLAFGELFTYTIVSPDSPFVLVNAEGVLTATVTVGAQPLAREHYLFSVRSTDRSGAWVENTFTVTVENQSPTALTLTPAAPLFTEPPAANTPIGTLATTDLDAGETFTYTILTAGSPFVVGGAAGVITDTLAVGTTPLAVGVHTVTVRSTDSFGASITATFTVTVSPPPPPPTPTLTLNAPTTVFTGTVAANTLIGKLTVEGGDGSESFEFAIEDALAQGANDALFVIGGAAGDELRVGAAPPPFGVHSVEVVATGDAGSEIRAAFTITVISDLTEHNWLPLVGGS